MSLIRIVDSTSRAFDTTDIFVVDVLNTDSESETYFIKVPHSQMRTAEELKAFIERDIRTQRHPMPDYKGLEWKSTSV